MSPGNQIAFAPGRSRAWLPARGRRLLLCGALLLAGTAAFGADAIVSKEYQIKAAFLYNFTKFIEWPADRFKDASSPIVIAVLGKNPFGDELEKIVRNRTVNGRSLTIVHLETAGDALPAHAVFIAAGEERLIENQIDPLIRAGVLVVGESERLAALGGEVRFTTASDKVRFEINLVPAERGGLKISAQLLTLATVVHRQP